MSTGRQAGPARRTGRRLAGRAAARLAAVQALYPNTLAGGSVQTVAPDVAGGRFKSAGTGGEAEELALGPLDQAFFEALVEGAVSETENLDNMLAAVLVEGWSVERLELVLRLILRAGAYELGHWQEVPARVAVSQYVDLAHAFLDDRQAAMVNGVLDRLAHSLRPEEFDGDPDEPGPDQNRAG